MPQQERIAKAHLTQQGFEVYFPRIWASPLGRAPRFEYLFPRYGFIRLDLLDTDWRVIRSTIGVSSLIRAAAGERPAIIADAEIARIRAARLDRVATRNTQIGAPLPPPAIGKRFRVLDGPFAEFIGICEMHAKDRVELLMTIFGRDTRVAFSHKQITQV